LKRLNSNVACSFKIGSAGQLKFTGLIRGFIFENEMMQEPFNDPDYMNSAAFPKTSFAGTIQNIESIDFSKDGTSKVTAEGSLLIHGVSKNITAPGTIQITGGKPTLKSIFKIKRADFGINTDEIAEELEITVSSAFK
jgi:polyisoprenoid-binding protein YceI